jgi:putative DNA primase/helicase
MQTAVVMYGDEGTGKNLLWGALRAIYGDHAGLITQMQLQGNFNSWLSAKLFLIANEVVTRHEMRHHVGYLKNLITEPEIYINRKMVDERREDNHANIVFLSNELQPLQIAPRDRRYMVIRTPKVRDLDFYKAVGGRGARRRRGGAVSPPARGRARGFNEHAKPIETQAKRDLIELGMPASQLYWQDLHDNVLGLPYVPALATDVYRRPTRPGA